MSSDDCHFFYTSSCSKGPACPYRHEPAALNNETICKFWLQGHCTQPHCVFRHAQIKKSAVALSSETICKFWLQGHCAQGHCVFKHPNIKNRSVIECYWESQPTGCTKPSCPFRHANAKEEPYEPETVAANIIPSLRTLPQGNIIVNKNKLDQIILPVHNRVVLPPRQNKVPIKQRLGIKIDDNIEVYECTDSEEELLRKDAMQTIDLRKRIIASKRKHSGESDFDSDEPDVQVKSTIVDKRPKKLKKKEKKEKKDKKRSKKDKRSLAAKALQELSPLRKTSSRRSDSEDEMVTLDDSLSLAARIAAQRESDGPGSQSIKRRLGGSAKDKYSSRKRRSSESRIERSVEIVNPPEEEDEEETKKYLSQTRKLKFPRKRTSSSITADEKCTVLSVIDDVDALLNSTDPLPVGVADSANDSTDVMKELDELINS